MLMKNQTEKKFYKNGFLKKMKISEIRCLVLIT